MTILKRWALGVCAFILAGSAWSQAVTVADVKYEPTQTLGDSTVQLNGACVRYKAEVKVYTVGLYLEKKASTTQEIASQRGPKRLSITMLREIDSTELGKLFFPGYGRQHGPRRVFAHRAGGAAHEPDLLRPQKAAGG